MAPCGSTRWLRNGSWRVRQPSSRTVSAVIFLVTAENELATTYIIGRVGNGDYGVALAYCTVLIVLMSLAIALIQFLVGERKLGRRKTGASAVAVPAI